MCCYCDFLILIEWSLKCLCFESFGLCGVDCFVVEKEEWLIVE